MELIEQKKLIAKCVVDRDHNAFNQLVKLHQSHVRNYARRLTSGDCSLADDIAQETFITAFEKIKSYSGNGSFIGWLLKICYRQFLQHLRKIKPTDDEANIDSMHDQVVNNQGETQQMLEQALSLISFEQRSAITLHLSFGHSQPEVAEIMQIPIGTVKSHIARGKTKLSELMSAATSSTTPSKNKGAA
mgnify:CR=1 FL=1